MPTSERETRRWNRAATLLILLTTIPRLAALSSLQLSPDEAYYWDWSRRLALGYYDQGPMIAYLIRASTTLFGVTEFGVRFSVLACSFALLVCVYVLGRRCFSARVGFMATVLLALTPLVTAGSLIATYDPPLALFWTAAAMALERAFFAPDAPEQRRAWLWAGVWAGCGLLSKHTMVLIGPCLFLFVLLVPRHRVWLRRPEPYAACGIVLLLYTGVLWWNAHHHWWTFGHLLFLTHHSSSPALHRFGDYLGSQALLVGPVLFLAAVGLGWRAMRPIHHEPGARPSDLDVQCERRCLLAALGLPVFLFFCLMALKTKVQGNWAICAWVTPAILAAEWAVGADAGRAWIRRMCALALPGALVTLLLVSPALRLRLGIRLDPETDISNSTVGWRETALRVETYRQESARQGRRLFLAGNGYQYPAELAFYLPDHPDTRDLFLHNRLTMYAAYVEELKGHLGEDALYLNDNRVEDPYLRSLFTSVEWAESLPIYRRPIYQEPVRQVQMAHCRGFRRYVGLEWADGG